MRVRPPPHSGSLIVAALAAPLALAGERTVALTPKAFRGEELLLPDARWLDVGGGMSVRHARGERFQTAVEGEVLRADLDGDGTLEARVEGQDGLLTFRGTSPEGHPLAWSVRVARFDKGPWKYAVGGAMVGEVDETRVQLVDMNLNGEFDDVGEDALIVGTTRAASYLSQVLALDGELWNLRVERDGSSLNLTPYGGPTATIDLVSHFESRAKLRSAVVRSTDGRHSFELSRSRGGMLVPAGDYQLVAGFLALGDSRARITAGRSRPLALSAGGRLAPQWGGPVEGEFSYQREGEELAFTPWDIWYYGKLGEEYTQFLPLGQSPEFEVADAASGKPLVYAKFPGNC